MSSLPSIEQPRSAGGLFAPVSALRRFADKLEFDSRTGCVLWAAGKTSGKGTSATYGSFWFEDRRWFAHRWAAMYIHGMRIEGLHVGHVCPEGPNGLCVHHLKPQTQLENNREMNVRRWAPAEQDPAVKQYWLLVGLGYEEPPEVKKTPEDELIPFYEEPMWYSSLLDNLNLRPEVDPHVVPF